MSIDLKRGWKKTVADRCRGTLWGAMIGARLDAEADAFLRDVIELHPERDAKVGAGIQHFEVRENEWNSRTFWLVRIDGTATDFSFTKALNPPTPMQDFAKACRSAVVDQIIAFKAAAFAGRETVLCPITGDSVSRDEAHVDHAAPMTFEALVDEFAAGRDIAKAVECTRDGSLITRFRDDADARAFASFHADMAVLRVVSKRANLGLLRRKIT